MSTNTYYNIYRLRQSDRTAMKDARGMPAVSATRTIIYVLSNSVGRLYYSPRTQPSRLPLGRGKKILLYYNTHTAPQRQNSAHATAI